MVILLLENENFSALFKSQEWIHPFLSRIRRPASHNLPMHRTRYTKLIFMEKLWHLEFFVHRGSTYIIVCGSFDQRFNLEAFDCLVFRDCTSAMIASNKSDMSSVLFGAAVISAFYWL